MKSDELCILGAKSASIWRFKKQKKEYSWTELEKPL